MPKQDNFQGLFQHEIEVLEKAKKRLNTLEEQPVQSEYASLVKDYERLLKVTKKICMVSDIQGKALKEKEAEVRRLLKETNDGIKKIEYLSYHDTLTLLYNRAYIDHMIPKLMEEDHFPISIIFVDVNGLKLINDVFGHNSGDDLLKKVSAILLECTRKSDIVARWGGDEFLVILPKTELDVCEEIIQQIKLKCKLEEKDPIEVSAAIGAAIIRNAKENINNTFTVAEKRMYKNKMSENQSVKQRMIKDLEAIVKSKHSEFASYVDRLRMMAERFAEILRSHDHSMELKDLQLFITLFTIGMNILSTKSETTTGHLEARKTNVEVGYRLARAIGQVAVAEAILGIYENWDGTGYPNGLQGEQIPDLSRMFSILNTFILSIDHSNRTVEEALSQIQENSGKQYDPMLVKLFINHSTDIMNPLAYN